MKSTRPHRPCLKRIPHLRAADGKDTKAAVFLDRDGTINIDVGYLSNPDELSLIDGSAAAIKKLNGRGLKVIVISNQSGAGRGYFTVTDVRAVNARLTELLEHAGARIDGIYCCPHRPDEGCPCRKPRPGLVLQAAVEHGVDPGVSYVVGDKASDMELAGNTGSKSVLVLTGMGRSEAQKLTATPDHIAPDIMAAVEWILADIG